MDTKKTAFAELSKISIALNKLHLNIWAGDEPLEIDLNEDWSRLFDVMDVRLNDVRNLLIKKLTK